ncbi:hypothetical protein Q7P36_004852 [Cladosporium allicinum]
MPPNIHLPGRSIPNCLYQYSLHATHLANQQQQQHPKRHLKPKPKQPDYPPVSFLTSYGDHGYGITPTGNVIALLNSQTYEFPSPTSLTTTAANNKTNTNNHPTRPPSPNTPLSFALVTSFHPENRIVTNEKIDPDPNKSINPEEPPLTLANLRIVMALKGKFHYDGRNHATPFAVRGAFRWIRLKGNPQGQGQYGGNGSGRGGLLEGVQGVIFGFLLPTWMRGAIGGPDEFLCCFGTFLEWATSDHFRVGLARENGTGDVEVGAGQRGNVVM